MHGPDSAGGNGRSVAAAIGGRGGRRGSAWHGWPHERPSFLRGEVVGRNPPSHVRRLRANFIYLGLVDESTGKVDPQFAGVVEAAASRARVVEFFYGTPDPALVEEVHAGGALVSWQGGSREEAIPAEQIGRASCRGRG